MNDQGEVSQLSRLLDEVLDLPPPARMDWIDALSPEFDELKPRLRELLMRGSSVESRDFLSTLPSLGSITSGNEAAVADTRAAGERVGPYRLVRPIGTGGMGAVWLAQRADGLFEREVALKLPHRDQFGARLVERMARERRILASLDHPNIARLYDAGMTEDGQPYIALEFIDGLRIDRYCAEQRCDTRKRLLLIRQVAHAVAYAHGKLIVHRDLKPANILVTADGQVRLLDFGIAKLLDDETAGDAQLTQASARAFTPDYASPEQIAGLPVTVASDVYSLGVVLYELLTGSRPYRLKRDSRAALEEAILEAEARRPSDAAADAVTRRALRGDIDAIALKALQKRPESRYTTVHAFADDIERHLAGRTVSAQPDRALYRIGRFLKRHKLATAVTAMVVVALLTATGTALRQMQLARDEQHRAEDIKKFIATIFLNADPQEGGGRSVTAQTLLQQARSRIDRDFVNRPEIRVELLTTVAASLANLDDYDSAEQITGEALAISRAAFGERHPLTREARMVRLDIERTRGRTAQLRKEVDELLIAARAGNDTTPTELIRLLVFDAHAAIDEGKPELAIRAMNEALPLAIRSLGERNQLTVGAAVVRAIAFRSAGRPIEAVDAAREALRLSLTLVDQNPKHAMVVDARMTYGGTLIVAGQPAEAVDELEHVLLDAAGVLGEDSMLSGFASSFLARAQLDTGDLQGALRNSERSLALIRKWNEPRSYTTGAALATRGRALLLARRPREARQAFEQSLDILKATIGPEHATTAVVDANLQLARAALGEIAAAEVALRNLQASGRKLDHWMSVSAPHALGIVHRLAAQPVAAMTQQRAALAELTDEPRAKFRRMAIVAELGLAALDAGDYSVAAASLTEALAITEREQRQVSPIRADALLGMARVRLHAKDFANATIYARQARDYWHEFNPESRDLALADFWLARCELAAGRREAARARDRDARAKLSKSPLPIDQHMLRNDVT